ncbi:MAG: amidohydrolase family protein [Kofleriaceae bacterium]
MTASAPVLSDERTGLVVDFFEPKAFTFQIDPAVPPVQFPDAADPTRTIAAIDTAFAELAAWAAKNAHDREIYVAQVGVYHTADAASQRAYLTAVRAALDRHHLAWATYDYESGCAMRGRDGTPTIAYEALGLGGPRATETRYAIVERGKTTEIIVVRTDGRDVGIHQPIDDTTRGISALQLDEAGLTARYDSYVASGAERDPDAKLAESFTAPARAVFYIPKQDDPLVLGMLARRLLEHPGERVALEPDGEATGELLGTLEVAGQPVTSLAIIGADLEPIVVWLDADRRVFAIPEPDPTSGTIVEAHAAALPALAAAQHVALARRAEAISSRLQHRPEHGLLVRHARVFDPATLAVIENTAILIRGATIEAIGPDARVAAAAPSGIEQIDAANRFVMPGLWDSHTHISGRARALMQLASGVTTVRDMGNEGDLPTQVKRYDTGAEIGPHAVLAMRFGIEGNRRMPRVTTPDEARAIVERAARAGYAHIKVLDDIDPALVPLLARLARARGMRFSGHVPKGLTVEQFVAAGAQEIQHIGGLFRGQPSGARAYDAMIAGRVALLRRRGVTLDPTLSGTRLASGDSGLTAVASDVLARLPPVARRAVERGAFTAAEQVTVRSSHAAFGRAVRAAIDTGVTVVPGTDARLSGFALRHELAAYVDLGIPAARVLRMATLEAARNMKLDARSGSLARGKVADLIVIAGDPTRDIGDLRNIELVVKNGWILSPPALLETVNIRPPAAVGGG